MCKMMQITAIVAPSFFSNASLIPSLAFAVVTYCCLSHVLTVTVCAFYAWLSPK